MLGVTLQLDGTARTPNYAPEMLFLPATHGITTLTDGLSYLFV